ncbi:unknown protein [Simkania negevensis Z]|uniref:Uncharacterized protein n=1 Tax=Simkania negevensis (strain ATCC VR-1471 / DSM 27360 / Z) TaxID=331113 RepID=F8L4Q6_SIMNZ|nr:unknown protein [Simkania negevensis Z]
MFPRDSKVLFSLPAGKISRVRKALVCYIEDNAIYFDKWYKLLRFLKGNFFNGRRI